MCYYDMTNIIKDTFPVNKSSGPTVQHLCIALPPSIHSGFVNEFKKNCLLTRPGCRECHSAVHKCWTTAYCILPNRDTRRLIISKLISYSVGTKAGIPGFLMVVSD